MIKVPAHIFNRFICLKKLEQNLYLWYFMLLCVEVMTEPEKEDFGRNQN
jgi:hypothetical protein